MATHLKKSNPKKASSRPRRTNAERSQETRTKLIDAGIDSLYRFGYSATTTIEVAKRARVSRGAMLHQFPTRVSLLLAVAEHVVASQREYRRSKLGNLTGLERFAAGADVNWEVQTQPSAIALIEIMMASRSDKVLRKGLMPFFNSLPGLRRDAAEFMAKDLGVDGVPGSQEKLTQMLHIHVAALRGLAIELLYTQHPEDVESARNLLRGYDRSVADALVAQAKKLGKK